MNVNTAPVTYSSIVEIGELATRLEKETGDKWIFAGSKRENNPLEVWNLDEYGDRSYMWEYR